MASCWALKLATGSCFSVKFLFLSLSSTGTTGAGVPEAPPTFEPVCVPVVFPEPSTGFSPIFAYTAPLETEKKIVINTMAVCIDKDN